MTLPFPEGNRRLKVNSEITVRKSARMIGFDYSSSRCYFVTICADGHKCLFGSVIPTESNGEMCLNHNGVVLDRHFRDLSNRYSFAELNKYVIMPNHVHMIIALDNNNRVSLTQIIGLFKSGVSRELGFSVWQRSYYDHIIRNETDYKKIWDYIENNPARWATDKYNC